MIPAPSCLGKLPLHGDFLRVRVQQAQKIKLDQWFSTQTNGTEDGVRSIPKASGIPWCFAIQGDLFGASRQLMAIGILFESADKIGRKYPFIMYQLVLKRWLVSQLKEPNHWLKILRDFSMLCPTKDSKQIDDMLKQLWAEYKPEWRDYFRAQSTQRIARKNQMAQNLLRAWQAQPSIPSVDDELVGVVNPPWLDWPSSVTSENVGSLWWRLDDQGRYLNCIQHPRLDKDLLDQLMA